MPHPTVHEIANKYGVSVSALKDTWETEKKRAAGRGHTPGSQKFYDFVIAKLEEKAKTLPPLVKEKEAKKPAPVPAPPVVEEVLETPVEETQENSETEESNEEGPKVGKGRRR